MGEKGEGEVEAKAKLANTQEVNHKKEEGKGWWLGESTVSK